jgi:ribosomal protein S18 acetylase RimI-like enzyme
MNQHTIDLEPVPVRQLSRDDLEAVISLDANNTGRRREEYFKLKLAQALFDTGIQVSLAADVGGSLAGFLLARVYYGEFGVTDRVAVLDTFGVHPQQGGRGVGRALLRQLRVNLQGLGIETLQTVVSWNDPELISFFHHAGFQPAPRFCLDLDLQQARAREEAFEASVAPWTANPIPD